MPKLKAIAEAANDMKAILGGFTIVAAALLWMLTHFASAEAFNAHVDNEIMNSMIKQRWDASQQMAQCARDMEDYGSMTISGAQACKDSESLYVYTSQVLCAKYKMFCPE